ncbi:MAG: sugar transferase [Lachnospiraceae bacterium]|nr:sugar transferase [Lachnospiraceae bacterium]
MPFRKWEELPRYLQTEAVRPYYEKLHRRMPELMLKRLFDVVMSAVLLVLLIPVFAVLAWKIHEDSAGPVFFRQVRVTQYGRTFRIFKFRTMVTDAEKLGTQVTVGGDSRVTEIGRILRKYRLDELPQLINIFLGDMSFVGTRPEVPRYVKAYSPEMYATLLMPAGVTSAASIRYKDEERLLDGAADPDQVYLTQVLPEKMEINLNSLKHFHCITDIATMAETVFAVLK